MNHPGVDQLAAVAPVQAPPAVPASLLELLARHDPERAEQVRRLCAGPTPDTVLVLGPAEWAVGRLAAALAARIPALLRCAPVGADPVRGARVAETRAVVWVFDAGEPILPLQWARLAELASQVDEVHLALAGIEPGSGGSGLRALRAGLGEALPRLADAPVHLLIDGGVPGGGRDDLVALLIHPAEQPGYRNALRVLDTGLARAQGRRAARLRHGERRALATDQAMRRQRDELADGYREVSVEWPRQLRADLAELKLVADAELSGALRRLRDDAREHLARGDRGDRARFPDLFGAAAAELAGRARTRLDALFDARFGTGLGAPATGGQTGCPVQPAISAPAAPGRAPLEDRLMLLVGVSGGLGLGRLALASAGALPVRGSVWEMAVLPVAVGLGAGAAWWLARARRAMTDRARLAQWVTEVLADLRAGLAASLSERLLDAERRLVTGVGREVTEQCTALAGELREHDLLARRVVARRAELTGLDGVAVVELRAARGELLHLLAARPDSPSPAPPLELPELAG